MSTEVAKKETGIQASAKMSYSERFTAKVVSEFTDAAGEVKISDYQRRLIKNYFIKLDTVLKEAEQKRMTKAEDYRDAIAVTWDNINMPKLATDVMAYSIVGLDPIQKNHLNLIPYKNSKTDKYDINFMEGYVGIELKAKKYGYEVPDDVIVEVVYEKDEFKSIKKSVDNHTESYKFEIKDDFDRGEIKGGFYYHVYFEHPEKNKLRVFNMKDIEKRIPKHASAEFWGGEKNTYVNGKKSGKEKVEGWRDEMVWKTLSRAAYDAIRIDSEKIDDHYLRLLEESSNADNLLPEPDAKTQVDLKIQETGNKKVIDIDEAEEVTDEETETKTQTKSEESDHIEIKKPTSGQTVQMDL